MGMQAKKAHLKCCTCFLCCERCQPLDCFTGAAIICTNGLPLTLACTLTATPDIGTTTCFNGGGTLTFKTPLNGGLCCWEGTIAGTCLDCNGAQFNWSVFVVVCCGTEGWTVSGLAVSPCGGPGLKTVNPTTCDPVLLSGCWDYPISACFVGCLNDTTPVPSPSYRVCFQIFEVP